MERRWSRRKQLEIEVLLRHAGVGEIRCKTQDLSFEGAKIITDQFSLLPSVEVELIFFRPELSTETVSIGAKVVRVADDGIGLNFQHYSEGSYRYLLDLLM